MGVPTEDTPRADSPALPAQPPAPGGRVDDIVKEIRAGLAQISAHELELRRREADVGR